MNNPQTQKILGYTLVATAILGVIVCLVGVIGVWMIRNSLESGINNTLEIAINSIEVTSTGLETAKDSLDTIINNINGLQTTILTVGQTINDTVPVVEEFAELFETSFPETIESTRTSLETAQTSAKLMDTVLFAVTNIPFYPGEPYAPEVPLNIALANVATDLEPLPESLMDVSKDLVTNAGNLSSLEEDIIDLSISITDINTDLNAAKDVFDQYLVTLSDISLQLEESKTSFPSTLNLIGLFLSVLFVWLGLTQVGLFVQGWVLFSTTTDLIESNP